MKNDREFEAAIFEEEQRFAPGWMFVVLVATVPVLAMQAYGTYRQLVEGRPWGTRPSSDRSLLLADGLALLVCIGVAWLMRSIRMQVRVTRRVFDVNFWPLRHKRVPLSEINRAYVRSFSPLGEYGGWGLRLSMKGNGWGYFLRGERGVQIVLRDGTKMLVGSQRPEQLEGALRTAQPSLSGAAPEMSSILSIKTK